VENQLIGAILDGSYPPGASLPGERELAATLGVSRPTLREALQRMARDGWITIRHGQPALVNDFWQEGNLNVLDRLAREADRLPHDFVTRLLEVRAVLAPAFGRAAVERSPARVVAVLAGQDDLDDDPDAFAAFDWQLQRHLARLSGNYVFPLLLNGFTALYGRAARQYFARAENRSASLRFYGGLLEAAMAGDAERAASVIAEAMHESIRLWEETTAAERLGATHKGTAETDVRMRPERQRKGLEVASGEKVERLGR
jgi:GntR family negative regulator for fad regulon and positive regulator of fabA